MQHPVHRVRGPATVTLIAIIVVLSIVVAPVSVSATDGGAPITDTSLSDTTIPHAQNTAGGPQAEAASHGPAEGPPGNASSEREGKSGQIMRSISMTDGKATIKGQVRYRDQNGNLVPAPQVVVLIRKRTTAVPTNKKIARTTTDDNGYYSVSIDISKWESNVDFDPNLRLRVQALAQNPAVNVVSFEFNQDTANGNTWTVNNDGSVARGTSSATFDFTITGVNERRAFQIANWTLQEYRFTRRETGWTRRQVKARYPAENDQQGQFRGFLEKFNLGRATMNASGDRPRHIVYHEYGHATMSGLFQYRGWQIPKYKGSHCIWSETGRIYAWYEGFATFMEAATVHDPVVRDPHNAFNALSRNIETYRFFNDSQLSHPACPDSDTGDFDGVVVEGSIANILWDVYDPANEPHDEIDGSLGEIFDAVNETDNKAWGRPSNNGRTRDIHDFFIQYVDNHPNRHEELRKIYFEYGINKPDRFEHDRSGSGDCPVHGYPCSKLDAAKWSTVQPGTSIDVGLHFMDTDYYKFNAEKGERVTINATVTGKAPDDTGNIALAVGTAKTSTVNDVTGTIHSSTRTENFPHEEVTFTAPKDGTYYVSVYDENGPHGGNLTYTFSVDAFEPPVYRIVVDSKLLYTSALKKTPGLFRGIYADERIDLKVMTTNGTQETVGIVMNGTRIESVQRGGLDRPTLVVRTDESTLQNVTSAAKPSEAAAAAVERGEITYHGVGLVNRLEVGVAKFAVGVGRFLGETFGVGPFG